MNIRLGNRQVNYPIIQGGMGIGVSLGGLSGSVAREGGMGTISAAGIGYREENFYKDPLAANKVALAKEVKKARNISRGRGLLGINIMSAMTDFEESVKNAVDEGLDYIISGAGIPLNLPDLVKGSDILLAPIVSSLKATILIIRVWKTRYGRIPDFIVVEGLGAGGHLGAKKSQLNKDYDLGQVTKSILIYLDENKLNIPIFVAGGLYGYKDFKKYRNLGARGIQLGTRFIATRECDASKDFKDLIVSSRSRDLRIINSPAGLPARAIVNRFTKRLDLGKIPVKTCINCLKTCNKNTRDFCISDALIKSASGRIEEGLVFAGESIDRVKEIVGVRDVFKGLIKEEA